MTECIHCGEAPATVSIWCQTCAELLGKEYMEEFERLRNEQAQSPAKDVPVFGSQRWIDRRRSKK